MIINHTGQYGIDTGLAALWGLELSPPFVLLAVACQAGAHGKGAGCTVGVGAFEQSCAVACCWQQHSKQVLVDRQPGHC